ncbi:hypothetical protein OVA11_15465 [Caulobacter sp. SL161]|uniref:hypothetical protein n=1 Tax=Caulobacter sp. SL161 TaxID=2995156 RepID=UPI002275EE73|nr:hypothetical protein [Caulobacter sp. SL161]MCY1648410.1 hypothetical protein [Caulobacter sp. SL161]
MRKLSFLSGLSVTTLMMPLYGCERSSPPAPEPPQTEVTIAQAESPATKALLNQGLERASKAFKGQAIAIEAFTSLSPQGEVVCAKYIAIKPSAEKTAYLISSPVEVDLTPSETSSNWVGKCSQKIKDLHLNDVDGELSSARNTAPTGPRTPKFNIQ